MKFELAEQDRSEELEPQIDEILAALGHRGALVTDESYISDFLCVVCKKEAANELRKLRMALGMRVDGNELVVDVAQRIKDGE